MSKEIGVEKSPDDKEKTRQFVKKNWPIALVVAGAAGVVGAAVWLTARFLREKKGREQAEEEALRQAEIEIQHSVDPSSTLLETGTFIGQIVGEEAEEATTELAEHIDDQDAQNILYTLGKVSSMNIKKSPRSNQG